MELWNQFGAVIIVLALLLGVLMWLRNRGFAVAARAGGRSASGKPRELQVIDRVVVSAQHTLVLISVSDTRMLVCLSPGASTVTVVRGEP
jgi:flagellar biogenesis protein FliO